MRKDPLNLDDSSSAAPTAGQSANVSETFTRGAQQAICDAQELARSVGSERVESAHLLLGALCLKPPNPQLSALFQLSGLNPEEVRLYARSALETTAPLAPETTFRLDSNLRRTMRQAGKEARHSGCAQVDVSHLVIACFRAQSDPDLAEVLAPLEVSADQLSARLRGLKRGETAASVQDQSPLAHLTAHGERALEVAHATMRAKFCGRISTLHLLIGVLENPDADAVAALQTLMVNVEELRARADAVAVGDGEIAVSDRRFTPAAKRALDRAKAAARDGGRSHIGSADLLLGLLPQPLLLIERAQFGARPDDPAAAILREVDANLVRAIFDPQQATTAPAKARVAINPLAWLFSPAMLIFALQVALGFALQGLNSHPVNNRAASLVVVSVIVGTIVLSAFLKIAAALFSKNERYKSTCLAAFTAAVAGAAVAMAVAGNP